MNKLIISVFFCFSTIISFSQTIDNLSEFNLGFEKTAKGEILPDKWFQWGNGYSLAIDTAVKYSGKNSMLFEIKGEKAANSVGYMAYTIPAIYEGTEIEVRAYMKLNGVTEGAAGLLLRIEDKSGNVSYDDMHEKNVRGTSDWTTYSVKLPYSCNSKTISVGAMLSGAGQLWVDDFRILIDGKDLKEAKLKYKALLDKEFDEGSRVSSIDLTQSKIEDLAVLGEIWGFLKYYHPAIAKGDYNWDYELFRIIPKVIDARSVQERNSCLYAWIASLGKVTIEKEKKPQEDEIKMFPDLSFIDSSALGSKLTALLDSIKNAQRTTDNFYVEYFEGGHFFIFNNENPYSTVNYPDAGLRLLALYRYWNILQYYNPYKYLFSESWTAVLKEFIPRFLNAPNVLEYKKTAMALTAKVHDAHAYVGGKFGADIHGLYFAPVKVAFVESKAVVTGYYDLTLGRNSGLMIGDVIEAFNSRSVDEIVKEKLPFTAASNYPTLLREVAPNLLRANDSIVAIKFSRNGVQYNKTLKSYTAERLNVYDQSPDKDTCYKQIEPQIAYLYLGSLRNEYLPEIWKKVENSEGIIIDLRCYPLEMILYSLSEYLMPQPIEFAKFSCGSITSPGLFTLLPAFKVGKINDNYYKGKVVILINEITQSRAEFTTMGLRVAPRATVIGSTTAGADGNVTNFSLPGGISTHITSAGVYYPDGRETQRVGIIPDIEMHPTIEGIRNGRDELLEKAIEVIKGK